ncbi:MAG: response regulator, partial [Acidimicrobiia bacterium]
FSTVAKRTDFSGDGEGLAAVGEAVELINGGIRMESRLGEGTTVILSVPASLALQNILIVRASGHQWGVPETAVVAQLPMAGAEIRAGEERMELWYQGRPLPLCSFSTAVGLADADPAGAVIILATRAGSVALTVPEVIGRRRVAVKSLGPILAGTPHLTGAALLGGGDVVVVVEPTHLGEGARALPTPEVARPRVLVVDDSQGVRQLVAATLSSRGYEVTVAADADQAARMLQEGSFDALVVDYSMPGSDGVQLVRSLRRARHGMPIVMVSSVAAPDDQARAWEAGVDAYLDKFDLRQGALASTLRSLLEMRGVLPQRSVSR